MATILVIIPYHFYPPMNGGSLRCYHLVRELARAHNIALLTVQSASDFRQDPVFSKRIEIITTKDSKKVYPILNFLPEKFSNAVKYRIQKKKLRAQTNTYFLTTFPLLQETIKRLDPSKVVFENLEVVGLFASILKNTNPKIQLIYDAHNVDSELWAELALAGHSQVEQRYAVEALNIEVKLHETIDTVLCCSQIDQEKLLTLNNGIIKPIVIPNGVDTSAKKYDNSPNKLNYAQILFCGSLDYLPNEEGFLWFYKNIFPGVKVNIPDVKLCLVGTDTIQNSYSDFLNDPSVLFIGRVEDVMPFYYQSTICIVPLLRGSGTRLKILEAMSFGNPVVSTHIGAAGIEGVDGKHFLLADSFEDFAGKVITLMKDVELFESVRKDARQLVIDKYDWLSIGEKLNDAINDNSEHLANVSK